MKIYLVCRNAPPNWDAVRVEVEDVVLCAFTSLDKADEHVDDMIRGDWHDANRCAVEHNARITEAIGLGLLTERETLTILEKVGYKRAPVLPIDAFRDNYFIHELEVEK